MKIDLLAIAAHPDDVELTCGGTVLKMSEAGYRTGILDLTKGETGTRGTPEIRLREAARAANILKASVGRNLGLPEARLEMREEYKMAIAEVIRELQPKTGILPYWEGRHPDHYTAATLGYEACFVAGLSRLDLPAEHGAPHRPYKILYASLYADVRPTFVVDITAHIETRLQSLLAYRSQYGAQPTGAGLFVPEEDIRERTFATARHYGLLAGVRYAEPFVQREIGLAEDLMLLPVQSI